jgi:hypothetical protein
MRNAQDSEQKSEHNRQSMIERNRNIAMGIRADTNTIDQ